MKELNGFPMYMSQFYLLTYLTTIVIMQILKVYSTYGNRTMEVYVKVDSCILFGL
jgi:hypothetical protein